jgi:hypothetical protein
LLFQPTAALGMVLILRHQPAHPYAGIHHAHSSRRPSATAPVALACVGQHAPISAAN